MSLLSLLLGIATTAHASPSTGVSVLLNGGFEMALQTDEASDQEMPASWQLSKGATLQWQDENAPAYAYEGEAYVRLSGQGAWAEQATYVGGEGSFVLSLWARQCGQAAWSQS